MSNTGVVAKMEGNGYQLLVVSLLFKHIFEAGEMTKSLKEGKIGPNWLLRRSDWLFNINVRFLVQPSIFIYFWRIFSCVRHRVSIRGYVSQIASNFEASAVFYFHPIFRRFLPVSVSSWFSCFALHFSGSPFAYPPPSGL